MQTQQAPQAPAPIPPPAGLGAPSQNVQSLTATDGGSGTTSPAPSGSLLQVFLPITAVQVTVSQSSQGATYIPNSGNPSTQQAYQFALDGNPGTITFSYTDTTTSKSTTYVVNILGQYGQLPASPSTPIINLPPVGPIYKGGGAAPTTPVLPLLPVGPIYNGGGGGSSPTPVQSPMPVQSPSPSPMPVQSPSPSPSPSPTAATTGMSSGTVAAIVVGVLAVAAAGGYAYYRHTHPAPAARSTRR